MTTTVQTFAAALTTIGGQTPVPIELGRFRHGAGVGLLVNIAEGGSADYDVEVTGNKRKTPQSEWVWNKHDVLRNKTANGNSNLA